MSSEIINSYERLTLLKNELEKLYSPLNSIRGTSQKISDEVNDIADYNSNECYQNELQQIIKNCTDVNSKLNSIQKKVYLLWLEAKERNDELTEHANAESRRN
jgi:uncharacterized phage infection (PIP) family protein YhgE